jgi:WD40 repeat protein
MWIVGIVASALAASMAQPRADGPVPASGGARRLPAAASPADYRAKWAVIIGIDGYPGGDTDLEPLENAANDAREFRRLLVEEFGYDDDKIRYLTDAQGEPEEIVDGEPTYEAIRAAFEVWLPAQEPQPDDSVLVFFAGHGLRDGYLAASDSRADEPGTCISIGQLKAWLGGGQGDERGIACRHKLVLLDCCFSGTLFDQPLVTRPRPPQEGRPGGADEGPPPSGRGDGSRGALEGGELGYYLSREAFVGMTAGLGDQPVADGTGEDRHSFFTRELLRAMRERVDSAREDHVFTFTELASVVRPRVAAAVLEVNPLLEQIPMAGRVETGEGDFIFRQTVDAIVPWELGRITRVQELVRTGISFQERGHFSAPAWFAAALREGGEDFPDLRAWNRLRLTLGLRNGPRLFAQLPHEETLTQYEIIPEGTHVLTIAGSSVFIWNTDGSMVGELSHQSTVRHAVLSADSTLLATLDVSNRLRVYRRPLEGAKEFDECRIPWGRAERLLFGPGSDTVLIAAHTVSPPGKNGFVIYERSNGDGKPRVVVSGDGLLAQWAVSPNRDLPYIATGSSNTLRLWEIAVGRPDARGRLVFEGDVGSTPELLAFDGSAKRLAFATEAGRTYLMDTVQCDMRWPGPVRTGRLSRLRFLRNGGVVACSTALSHVFLDTDSGAFLDVTADLAGELESSPIPTRSRDLAKGVMNLDSNTVRVVHLTSNQPSPEWTMGVEIKSPITLSNDGSFVATAGPNGFPQIVRVPSGEPAGHEMTRGWTNNNLFDMAFSPTGALHVIRAGVPPGDSRKRRVYERIDPPYGNDAFTTIEHNSTKTAIAFFRNGDRNVCLADQGGEIDFARGSFEIKPPNVPRNEGLTLADDERALFVWCYKTFPQITAGELWNLADADNPIRVASMDFVVSGSGVFSPDSRTFAVCDAEAGKVRLYRSATGEETQSVSLPRVVSVDISSKGDRLACGNVLGSVVLCAFDSTTGCGTILRSIEQPSPVRALQFTPDGRLLVVAWEQGTITLIEADTGDWIHTINYSKPIVSINVNNDCLFIIENDPDRDGGARLDCWDISDNRNWPDEQLIMAAEYLSGGTVRGGTLNPLDPHVASTHWDKIGLILRPDID